jgi:uncharacterized protein
LVTFFAAAKKVTPPPGRRLLNKQTHNKKPKLKEAEAPKKPKPQKIQ